MTNSIIQRDASYMHKEPKNFENPNQPPKIKKKNRKNIITNFLNGHHDSGTGSLSTSHNGHVLYSYYTPLAYRKGNTLYVNNHRYSHTTSTQQNEVKRQAESKGINVVEVSPEQLNSEMER